MKTIILSVAMLLCLAFSTQADPGDTLIVQTYTFEEQNNPDTDYDSPGRRWFDMPEDDGTTYQKILMYYTLKCFEDGTAGGLGFDCGEWDYTSHSFLYEHTGELDSNALEHPRYLVNNENFDELSLSDIPLTNTYTYEYENLIINNVISEEAFSDYMGIDLTETVEAGAAARIQFYLDPTYLSDIGATVGEFQRLAFNANSSSTLTNFRVSSVLLDQSPTELYEGAMMENYFDPAFEAIAGLEFDMINFQTPLNWDGTSGILFEMSFEDCSDDFNMTGVVDTTYEQVTAANDKYMHFNGGDQVKLSSEVFDLVSDEVTVCYWLKGDAEFQPENNSTFEGLGANNQRILNVHNPWSNGQVYWDAGDDGGYDRINQQANTSDYAGQWNHWAFTKNATTGDMKIFLNGEEWHSGTDKDNLMMGIETFYIGSSGTSTNFYRGAMDDFYILNRELDEAQVQEYMNGGYDITLPFYNNILGYFDFNGEYGEPVNNAASGLDGITLGNPSLIEHTGIYYDNEIISGIARPVVVLYRGEYETTEETATYTIEIEQPPVSIIEYAVDGNGIEIVNTSASYPIGYSVIYDVNGVAIDSTQNTPLTPLDITNETLNYFSPAFEIVNRIELGRFITPYGIGLDLEEGWTWVYDVTDYDPLLRGEVELEAGNWQELLDLKFAFIEGTPARDVKRIENIWNGNWQLSTWDENIQEQTIPVLDGEEMFRVKATTSGHWFGQGNNCAEFCSNTHSLKVNGTPEYSWEIMQECADNPLYPQGGTWIYDRAGWCPGAPVTTRNLEVSEFVSSDEFSVEYDITYDPYGNYWLMGQLVSYGEPNFTNEVEVSEILAPSDVRINSRMNPICDNPMVRIRNNGTEPLTSCDITFGINGNLQTYSWSGNLAFLETEDVTLTYTNDNLWLGDDEELMTFTVEITSPNGVADENPSNNATSSNFLRPPTYGYDVDEDDNRIIIETTTNSTPWETEIKLLNIDGSTHWTGTYTEANTLHRDTLTLNAGCYLLHIKDSDDDGLDFFANNDGDGGVAIKEVGSFSYFKNFQDNFGKEIKHYFNFETDLYDNITEEEVQEISVYPNPSRDAFFIRGVNITGNVTYTVFNSEGKEVLSGAKTLVTASDRIEFNLGSAPSGLYSVQVTRGDRLFHSRVVKQ